MSGALLRRRSWAQCCAADSVGAQIVGSVGEPCEPALLPPEHRSPESPRLGMEQIIGPDVKHEPSALVDLGLELEWPPSCVPPEHPQFIDEPCDQCGIFAEIHRKDLVAETGELVAERGIRCTFDGAEGDQCVGVDRAAAEHHRRCRQQLSPTFEGRIKTFSAWAVDHDSERSIAVMFDHEHHRAVEIGIRERRGRHEDPALGRWGDTGVQRHHPSLPALNPIIVVFAFMTAYAHAFMKRIGIIGASGFTGAELLRLLAQHPECEVGVVAAGSQAGRRVSDLYPSQHGVFGDLVFSEVGDPADPFATAPFDGLDAVFLALPHSVSADWVEVLRHSVGVVIDLSAAYRLRDAALYTQFYDFEHPYPALLHDAVYGLPEKYRAELKNAAVVATPGCYVTAATLALEPLVAAGLAGSGPLIVDAASGVTGAGREPTATNLFTAVDSNLCAYGLMHHRHTPEMEQEIGAAVLFTPHLAPMSRGILATCYATSGLGASDGVTTESLMELFIERYRDEPFVHVVVDPPQTKATLGSNSVQISVRHDQRTSTTIVMSALDNLTKGASGGALQSANLALGLQETLGLPAVGVQP